MPVKLGGNIMVTGANRGIGLELGRQLVENTGSEDHIYACCRDPAGAGAKALRELADKHPEQMTVIQLDVSDEASISAAIQEVGTRFGPEGLNLLINNAAINQPAPPALLSATSKRHMMDVYETNVVGPFLLTKELFPYLQRAAGSSKWSKVDSHGGNMSCRRSAIINISTLISSIEKCPETYSMAQMYPYRSSKAALNMLTRCQAEEFRKDGILVTAIHPGWVRTDMGGEEAPLTPVASVQGMLSLMSSLCTKDSGHLVDWQGNSIPW